MFDISTILRWNIRETVQGLLLGRSEVAGYQRVGSDRERLLENSAICDDDHGELLLDVVCHRVHQARGFITLGMQRLEGERRDHLGHQGRKG